MSVIGLDFKKPFTLTRGTASTFSKGRAAKGVVTVTIESGSIQALREEELLQLPEGQRNKGAIVIYTEPGLVLLSLNETDNIPADIIEFNGQKYEVQIVEDWTYLGIGHNRTIAIRLEKQRDKR